VLLLLGALAAAPAFAGEHDRVVLQIGTVLATNTGDHFDSQLATLRPQLESMFRYSSYSLVRREDRDVTWGSPVIFDIPGGRSLRVMPKSVRGGRVSLNVMLVQDTRVLMDTDLTLRSKATVMVGGPRHGDGVLIIWIGARPVGERSEGIPAAATAATADGEAAGGGH
jgi:hypothetical protein